MYKSMRGDEKCLPEVIIEPNPWEPVEPKEREEQEVKTKLSKLAEKTTTSTQRLGDSKYHYLMVDGSTSVAVPFDSHTMKVDSTWICEKMAILDGDVTYVCKKIQTQDLPEISSIQHQESRSDYSYISEKSSKAKMAIKRKGKSLSIRLTESRKSIQHFFSNLRRRSRTSKEKKSQKLTFNDEPSVILLRRSQSMPTGKTRWNSVDYETSLLKFIVQEQKNQDQKTEESGSTLEQSIKGGVCRPVVRLFNAIRMKLRKKKIKDTRQSTHVIKIIYVEGDEDDKSTSSPSITIKHSDQLPM
ncbi:unnamed protein product [Acanthoscelides obtectus]|nr:unnamed protein product [Acanthoscelides obtectus]CAK1657663.1 hypothetical protein AOBTE_LOCUS20468 [Acanthoscelides obtectus]